MNDMNEKSVKSSTKIHNCKAIVLHGNVVSSRIKNSTMNTTIIDRKSSSMTPDFLMRFEIFNNNVHYYLVDIEESSNIITYVL